jgi:hypothetical protein
MEAINMESTRGKQQWFAVRCIFVHEGLTYEERITIWKASSFNEAYALAEGEAHEYAADGDRVRYVGLAQAFRLFDVPGHGAEVFSLLRYSELPVNKYLNTFFDTGQEYAGVSSDGTESNQREDCAIRRDLDGEQGRVYRVIRSDSTGFTPRNIAELLRKTAAAIEELEEEGLEEVEIETMTLINDQASGDLPAVEVHFCSKTQSPE